MPQAAYTDRLTAAQRRQSSHLCVGLDPDPDRLPRHLLQDCNLADAVLLFNRAIIEHTASEACAFKLNLAFYEALRGDAWRVLKETLAAVPSGIVTIADGKRGDVGNSARFYARSTFDQLGFDACTVSGYMGRESIEPFLEYGGRGAYLLVRTSNPGAEELQGLGCGERPLFEHVARLASKWDAELPGTIGFVVGATNLDALGAVRSQCPSVPLLIPGIGAQGGDAEAVMQIAAQGDGPVVVNSSRSIIYASSGPDFAEAAGEAAASARELLAR